MKNNISFPVISREKKTIQRRLNASLKTFRAPVSLELKILLSRITMIVMWNANAMSIKSAIERENWYAREN